jgi:ribonucleoside-diphosphate reductase beta chain
MKDPFNTSRKAYRPFDFPWAYDKFRTSEQMHWLPTEVPLAPDVGDWHERLTDHERGLLTHVFQFFTQADVDVAAGYIDRFMPRIRAPELRMMMASFAAREAIHIDAYSTLIDQLGMDDQYGAFLEYKEMVEKHEFMFSGRGDVHGDIVDLAVFSAFGEGLQLFSSFVILLNFPRRGLMKGMGQMVSWSIRDETLHVDGMTHLFRDTVRARGLENDATLGGAIYECCEKMVELEDNFIDLAYGRSDVEGLGKEEVKRYIRYVADVRLRQLGMPPLFDVDVNPLPWVDELVFGQEEAAFFETKATDYGKGAATGSFFD